MAFRASSTRGPAVAGWSALTVGMTCALLIGVGSSAASASTADGASGVIRSVTFSGTPAKPTITITGKALSIPSPNPAVSPSNQPLCPRVITGNAGHDYGTRFYVLATANGKPKFAAGRYRPMLNELDCVGLIVLSHTSTKIRLRFGAAYKEFGYAAVVNGDHVKVVLNGSTFRLVVRYH